MTRAIVVVAFIVWAALEVGPYASTDGSVGAYAHVHGTARLYALENRSVVPYALEQGSVGARLQAGPRLLAGPGSQAAPPDATAPHRRLFRPQDLGLLEFPDRDKWQKPDLIMDALNIADGSRVADIGAGAGWFTIRLARRVGPRGTVYAQDVQREMLEAIRRRVAKEALQNVETLLGRGSNPNLPPSALDAVLIVDVYPEVAVNERVTFLRNLSSSLKPNGRIGIVNYKPGRGGPGPAPDERVDASLVETDAQAAGLRVLSRETFLPYQYLLVLGRS